MNNVPSKPSDLGFDPKRFPIWREHQRELIEAVVHSKHANILVNAPPGFGKSLFAAALAEVLGGTAQYLVTTKSLQLQIAGEFDYIFSMWGRNNHHCALPGEESKTVDKAICNIGYQCELRNVACPYYLARAAAYKSRVMVTNYSWFFHNNEHSFPPLPTPTVLICDEADTIEAAIMGYAAITITAEDAWELGLPLPNAATMNGWLAQAKVRIAEYEQGAKEKFKATRHKPFDAQFVSPDDMFTLSIAEMLANAERLKDTIGKMENGWKNHATLYVIDSSPLQFTIRPIVATLNSHELIEQRAPKRVFMSATILDKQGFCDELGLSPTATDYIDIPSTFPVEHRPLYLHNRGFLNNKTLADSLPDIVEWIDDLIAAYGMKKGIIHTTSYRIAQYILQNSTYRDQMIGHKPHNRATAIKHFKHKAAQAVIVSPSLVRGEDFPGHHAEWQAIVKAPYPNIADPQVKARMELDNQWVTRVTLRNLIQAYGRGTRKEDDVCATHVYDANVTNLLHRASTSVPLYIKDAIIQFKGE